MDENDSPHFKDLLKGFESNHVFAHMHPYDLFRQWLEAVWALLNLPMDVQTYKTTLDAYTFAQGQELGRLFNLYRHCSREACLEWEQAHTQEKEDEKHGGLK